MSTLAKQKKCTVYVCVCGERKRKLKCNRQDAKTPVPCCTQAVYAFLLSVGRICGYEGVFSFIIRLHYIRQSCN